MRPSRIAVSMGDKSGWRHFEVDVSPHVWDAFEASKNGIAVFRALLDDPRFDGHVMVWEPVDYPGGPLVIAPTEERKA